MTPEVRAFEYSLGLFAVLIGLAVADIANSFHRLVRSRTPVRWDALPLLAALYALCMAVGMWFDLWGVRHFADTRHFFFYLWMIAAMFVLFLIAAAALPDEPGPRCDLGAYYADTRRYFWTLVALFQLAYLVLGLYFVGPANLARMRGGALLLLLNNMFVPVLIALTLRRSVSRPLHYLGIALLLASLALHYGAYQIN
ncbi:MAG: hypothetical protein JSR36_05805 [Proteobacteria bacterium]|nr:hypothetical protein [Pseudomonadota bacterium]